MVIKLYWFLILMIVTWGSRYSLEKDGKENKGRGVDFENKD